MSIASVPETGQQDWAASTKAPVTITSFRYCGTPRTCDCHSCQGVNFLVRQVFCEDACLQLGLCRSQQEQQRGNSRAWVSLTPPNGIAAFAR